MLKENYPSGANDAKSLIAERPSAQESAVKAIICHDRARHGGMAEGHAAFMGHSANQH